MALALDGPVDGRFRVWMVPDSSHAEEQGLGAVVVCFRLARPVRAHRLGDGSLPQTRPVSEPFQGIRGTLITMSNL